MRVDREISPMPSQRMPRLPASIRTCSCRPISRSRRSSRPGSTAPSWWRCSGNYDDVNRLCTELSGEHPWAFVNVNLRPYYAEGSKTLAYEVAEQLGFELPDRVVCPVASGSLFTRIARGFEEWLDIGLIRESCRSSTARRPTAAVPSRRRSPTGTTSAGRCGPNTIAKSLAIGNPADGAVRDRGCPSHRRDDRRRSATRRSSRESSCSPRRPESSPRPPAASRRPFCAKLAERGEISADERVVLYITGEGLKTLDAVRDVVDDHEVEPTVESFDETRCPVAVQELV